MFEDCDRFETWGREMRDHRGALLRALDLAAKAWRYAPHMGPRRSAESGGPRWWLYGTVCTTENVVSKLMCDG